MQVPFLSRTHIENATLNLLRRYETQIAPIPSPPIPVEEIVECLLKLDFRLGDLTRELNQSGVLGAVWMNDARVMIDESLDPSVQPTREGRYRFTVAHEVGHWDLHKPLFDAAARQPNLFAAAVSAPSIACRAGDKESIEWQADAFAGFLLMPEAMLRTAWRDLRGSDEPYIAEAEIAALTARWSLTEDRTPTVTAARALASVFKVSGQAMQIRLLGLVLIKTDAQAAQLFTTREVVANA